MTWAPETNIKGPKGDTGATGATGAQGSPGVPGPVGPAGPPGASGAGTGNVVGPATSVVDDIATYNNVSGTLIKDSGVKVTDLVSAATLPETIDDRVAALLVAGTNITLNYNDPANTLTINGTGSGAASGITVTPSGNLASTNVQAALTELDNEKVAKAGDTMTGPLVLPAAAPTLGPQAANKTYVDAQIAALPVTPPIYMQDTAPAGPPDGALWVETDTGLLFFRWNDGTSLQWVSLGNATGNAVLYTPQTLTAPQQTQARLNIAAGQGPLAILRFGSSGTYTPTAGMTSCIIECVGGGGGGSGSNAGSSNTYGGAGGGSGGYSRKLATAAQIGVSQIVTIGAAGAQSVGAVAATAGGTTSVGSLCIANGGGGAGSTGYGGVGGPVGTGDFTCAGAPGGAGFSVSGSGSGWTSGNGGSSHFGGGAQGVATIVNTASNGISASSYGSGGGGSTTNGTSGNAQGGAGSAGVVVITEYR